MNPVRAGVVGVGYLGRFHAQKYAANPAAVLVGVTDADPKRARAVGQELSVPVFAEAGDLIDQVEALSVVTPAASHHALAREALASGVHCLVEKPMTENLNQADELITLARENALVLQVGHLERFNPAVEALLQNPVPPRYIEARRLTPFVGRGTDIDVILELMIHDLDIILSLIREEPSRIRAVGAPLVTRELDMANAYLEFPSGCVANLTASRVSSAPCRRLDVFHDQGRFTVDCAGRTLTTQTRNPEKGAEVVLPGVFSTTRSFEPTADPLALEIDAFLGCVRNNTGPLVDGRAGRDALALALRISETIGGGRK